MAAVPQDGLASLRRLVSWPKLAGGALLDGADAVRTARSNEQDSPDEDQYQRNGSFIDGVPTADKEALQMLGALTNALVAKRSLGDFMSIALDPSVVFRLHSTHRRRYRELLEAFEPVTLEEAFVPQSSLPADCAAGSTASLPSTTQGFLPGAAAAAVYARAAYGALMQRGAGDRVSAFLSGAATAACGRWGAAEHLHAFTELADVQEEDVLLYSWAEKTFEPAFVVFLDHKLRWLVVAVRGSMEWKSVLTDIAADTCELAGGKAHSGMARAARWLNGRVRPLLAKALEQHPEYRVVCTGHSLGANVASILALLLREELAVAAEVDAPIVAHTATSSGELGARDIAPSSATSAAVEMATGATPIEAFAFGFGPSPLMSPDLAMRCAPFVLSVARNVDYVTRLCAFSADRLTLELTERSAAKLAKQWLSTKLRRPELQDNEPRNRVFGQDRPTAEVLVPPGQLLHVDSTFAGAAAGNSIPNLSWPLPGFYQELFISPQMFHDHLPIRYVEDLLRVLRAGANWHAPQLHLASRAHEAEAQQFVLAPLRTLIVEQMVSPDCVARLVLGQPHPSPAPGEGRSCGGAGSVA